MTPLPGTAAPGALPQPVADALAGVRTGTPRRLSSLLDSPAYLANTPAARAACASGLDPLLYTAFRDVLPPRQPSAGGGWYADLVRYEPGPLPGPDPELCRSVGHWNAPAQLEIFQPLTGRVLMLTAYRATAGRAMLSWRECGPGDLLAVPFGAWHLTCVLNGPAAVFNLYTDLPALSSADRGSRYAACHEEVKYGSGTPVEITARQTPEGFRLTGTPRAWGTWGRAESAPAQPWLREVIGHASLPAFFTDASSTDLARLQKLALAHLPRHDVMPQERR